jgi:hypothetical protein
MDWIEECPSCKRPFSVTASGDYPWKENAIIACPHPHCEYSRSTARVRFDYDTAPLTPEQEEAYRAGRLKARR